MTWGMSEEGCRQADRNARIAVAAMDDLDRLRLTALLMSDQQFMREVARWEEEEERRPRRRVVPDGSPRLEYGPLPEVASYGRADSPYLYMRYVPLVEEFAASSEDEPARVVDDVCGPKLLSRVQNAIFNSSGRGVIEARMRQGDVWLVRRDGK